MGGMGPDATVDFMTKVIRLTAAERDQDHVHMLVDQDPAVPNRQVAISGGPDDVSPHLTAMARRLESAGADFLVMVCNTAHVFVDDMQASITIPFISIIDESVAEIERVSPDAKVVGIMATDGCIATCIYQRAVEASGRRALVPDENGMRELMRLIGAIKSGDQGHDIADGMAKVADDLVAGGAEILIAGCTEIPLVFDGAGLGVPVVSSTDVLARRTVELATGQAPLPGD